MVEKMTTINERRALVEKIKTTGLKEIEIQKLVLKDRISELDLKNKRDYELFDFWIREVMSLNILKDYFKSPDTMFSINWADNKEICYIIPTADLELWLDSGVVQKYLAHVDMYNINPTFLSDRFFGNGFISIIERMAYEEKKKKEIEKLKGE